MIARRTRSGTVVGPVPTSGRRERSGTVVARPSVIKPVPVSASRVHRSDNANGRADRNEGGGIGDVDMQESVADEDIEDHLGGDDVHMLDLEEVEVDEDEDPLNLKDCWRDEDWIVAEPPSPVVSRKRTGKRMKGLAVGLGLKSSLCQMTEHDEDDGGDDPLSMLK